MRAGIFNPYLDTLGGGERYTLSFAKVLLDAGYKVDVEWKDASVKKKLESRFGIDLKEINFVNNIKRGDGYDICFWVSDGSIPTLLARKNFLHFQVPFRGVGGKSLLNKMKLFRINKIICNSDFTKKTIDEEFGVKSIVVYPPVDTLKIKPKRKENLILNVARFSQLKQSKSQDVLVKTFKKMVDQGLENWKLILIGGIEVGVGDYIERLEKLAGGYPVQIIKSPDFKTLVDLYGRAKIFWSASGFGIDEEKNPENLEHFGITVVEAMAGGAVPVIFNGGGHKEIVKNGVNGFLWETGTGLVEKTLIAIKKRNHIMKESKLDSQIYSYEKFEKNIKTLL